jgi:hypothetical protein
VGEGERDAMQLHAACKQHLRGVAVCKRFRFGESYGTDLFRLAPKRNLVRAGAPGRGLVRALRSFSSGLT